MLYDGNTGEGLLEIFQTVYLHGSTSKLRVTSTALLVAGHMAPNRKHFPRELIFYFFSRVPRIASLLSAKIVQGFQSCDTYEDTTDFRQLVRTPIIFVLFELGSICTTQL